MTSSRDVCCLWFDCWCFSGFILAAPSSGCTEGFSDVVVQSIWSNSLFEGAMCHLAGSLQRLIAGRVTFAAVECERLRFAATLDTGFWFGVGLSCCMQVGFDLLMCCSLAGFMFTVRRQAGLRQLGLGLLPRQSEGWGVQSCCFSLSS